MQKLFWQLVLITSLLPMAVWAHGGGQPLLTINGQPVQENSLSGLDANLPQDVAPTPYVTGQIVAPAVNPDQAQTGAAWRWEWGDGAASEGATASHAYAQPGSYVLKLQTKIDPTSPFSTADTVGVQVVPRAGYSLPAVKVSVVKTVRTNSGYEVSLEAVPSADPSATTSKIAWKFGDGGRAEGRRVTHQFVGRQNMLYPLLQVTDSNNVKTDAVFALEMSNKSVTAKDLPVLPGIVKGASAPIESNRPTAMWGLLAAVLAIAAVWLIKHVSKRRAKTKH